MPKSPQFSKTLLVASGIREVEVELNEDDFFPGITNRGKDVVIQIYLPDSLQELLGINNPNAFRTFSLRKIVEESDNMPAKEQLAIIRGLEEIVDYLKRDHAEFDKNLADKSKNKRA